MMFPISNYRPTTTVSEAPTATLDKLSQLTSSENFASAPTTPSSTIATMSGETDTIQTLAQKIEQFNADENAYLLVSIFRNTIYDMVERIEKKIEFSIDYLKNELIARRNASLTDVPDTDAPHPVNFSASLLTPTTLAELFWRTASRITDPGDWDTLPFPDNITPQQKDHLLTLTNKSFLASLGRYNPEATPAEQAHAEAVHLAAVNEFRQAWLALWEGRPDVIYRCPELFMGFIASDQTLITSAFPKAGGTLNRHYTPRASLSDGQVLKSMAAPQGGRKSDQIEKRDKHFKIVAESIIARGRKATFEALAKHEKKHAKECGKAEINEVLIVPSDNELSHFIDGFFLDMRSGFEKMNLDTVNLYLYHNRDIVLKKMAQIQDFPLLVNYSDLDSGRHKFAYVTLNAEGVPVAMTQPPVEDRLPR